MKTAVLCGIALVCSSAAFAQTPPASGDAPKAITLTGCVAGGVNAQPITLTNAMVIPAADAAGESSAAPSPVPPPVSPPATQPPSPVGTSGTVVGTAPAGSSTSSASGYRLSGVDMSSWLGKRVEIVGSVVAAPIPPAAGTATAASAPGTVKLPELRVVSVQPATGSCSEK
jgi:hypothetical protein